MFAITVKMSARKGKEEELVRLIRETTATVSKNEKETIHYIASRNMKNPSEFFLYEQYTSRDSWEKVHMSKPYVKSFIQKVPELIQGELDATEYETL
jgi:quinol monooxygenase YgiN